MHSHHCISHVSVTAFAALTFLCALSTGALAQAPPPPESTLVVGRNSNMLGGEQILRLNPFEVRGDVLGRADNEPSCAFSTRKPQHVLCGANTYRMVDVPGVSETMVTRDAWQGIYQSPNGGDTWESTLHPGFFLDPRPHVLKALGFRAAADATVRSGPAGMAWHSGIAFRPDRSVNSMFVSTFADLANQENDPMPFKFVRTVIVDLKATPKFIDKPWLYVEAAPPGQMCTIAVRMDDDGTTPLGASTWWGKVLRGWLAKRWPNWRPRNFVVQQVPASIIHVVYSIFLDASDTNADLMYSRSTDCGATFSTPRKLSTVAEPANGAAIAKAPVTGSQRVIAAWRRVKVAPTGKPHAILATVSTNNGGTWAAPRLVAEICPFEQGTTANSFRTTAFPTMTVDASGRAYVAWADRGRLSDGTCNPFGAGRVTISTSTNGVNWSQPMVAVPSATGEHQIFPSLAFTAGKLFLAWVDFTEDASGVFGQYVDEANLFVNGNPVSPPARRHTADVRVAMAAPGTTPDLDSTVAQVSKYLMGRTPSVTPSVPGQAVQLQWNAQNRRWARKNTVPFNGDYIDIATRPYLPPDPAAGRPNWTPNNGQVPTTPTVLIAWTDNRDMRDVSPAQLNANGSVPFAVPFNVPGVLDLGTGNTSIFDPSQQREVCTLADVFKTGTTNQNIYAASAVVGFAASSPSAKKPLGLVTRSFVVYVRNDTDAVKTFRLQIAAQPPGGIASFDQFTPGQTVIQLIVPRHSSVARTVFVSKNATATPLDPQATVRVDVTELVGGAPGATDAIYLNADRSAPEIDSPEIDSREIYLPEIDSPEIDSIAINSPEIDSPEIDSPEIDSETLKSLGLQSPEIDSPEIDSPEIDSPEIDSPEIDSPEIDSAPMQDFKVEVTNTGNTTAQYNAKSFVKAANVGSFNYQLIVRQKYNVRAVGLDCLPTTIPTSKVLVNLLDVNPQNPEIDSPEIDSPEIDSAAPSVATFFLPPGGKGQIIVRARKLVAQAPNLTLADVDIAAQQKAVDSDDAAAGITEPPVVTTFLSIGTSALPAGRTGTPYLHQLVASGGVPPYVWSIVGSLPPGLIISPDGIISGTPTVAGSFAFTVRLADSDSPQGVVTRDLAITITTPGVATLAFVSQPSDSAPGQTMTPAVSVRAFLAAGAPAVGVPITLQRVGGGALNGTLTRATGQTGVAVFDNLSIPAEAAGVQLTATAVGFAAATSVAFDVETPAPSGTLFGSLSDPSGDAGAAGNPDLVSATISVNGSNMTLSVRFTPTFGPNTAAQFILDTDQNPATGNQGSDSLCTSDNGVIGLEYVVDFGPGSIASVVYGGDGTQASILPFVGPGCNSFGNLVLSASGSVTNVYDEFSVLVGMDVTLPLSLIGGDDGPLNFKVLSYRHVEGNSFTGVLDRVSEIGQPAGQVPNSWAGSLVDPSGDAGAGNPDLVSSTISVNGSNMTLSVRFASGTFSSSTTVVQFALDTDKNPSTGHPGTDSGCPTPGDNGVIGLEYIVNMGSTFYGTQARIQPYAGSCNNFGAGTLTASGSVTYVTNGMDVTFPLSLIGNDDGRLYFKVLTERLTGPGTFTGILDRMSNVGLAPGEVPEPN